MSSVSGMARRHVLSVAWQDSDYATVHSLRSDLDHGRTPSVQSEGQPGEDLIRSLMEMTGERDTLVEEVQRAIIEATFVPPEFLPVPSESL